MLNGNNSSTERYFAFVAAAVCTDDDCEATSDASFSLSTLNVTNFSDSTSYEACIDKDDSSTLSTDGSKCSGGDENAGMDVADALSGAFSAMRVSTWDGDLYDTVNESTSLSFDSTNFTTASFTNDGDGSK